jgi:heptosyltransferase-2
MRLLVLKTGALGDVLRTTSILPGLHARHPDLRVTWVTAPGAVPLVAGNPRVAAVVPAEASDPGSLAAAEEELGGRTWDRVLSFDDEEPVCALATRLAGGGAGVLTGAHVAADGRLAYTPDSAPWFEMGLLSVHGKEEADRRKKTNRASHPAIFAELLGIEMGEPELLLPAQEVEVARAFEEEHGLRAAGPLIGLNTGAGGRWTSKALPVERVLALMRELTRRLAAGGSPPTFVLLGGPDEAERNVEIAARAAQDEDLRLVDAGVDRRLLEFAAIVDRLDLLVTSDSLALHVGIARRVPILVFFAPTSAAEIELYGRGEKVESTAPDACSYRPDADTSTLTVERLADAAQRVLAGGR